MSAVLPACWVFRGLRLAVLRASYFRTFYTTVSFCLSLSAFDELGEISTT
jgi:hypothetical protein